MTNEQEIMKDLWLVYKKYYEGADADNDAFWENCVMEFAKTQDKYKTQFAKDMTWAFLSDIERRSRDGV